MQDLLLSNEFRRYRKAQINEVVKFIKPMLLVPFDGHTTAEIKGALDMARKLMQLPQTFPLPEDVKARIKDDMHEDMKEFEVKFIRSHLIDDSR